MKIRCGISFLAYRHKLGCADALNYFWHANLWPHKTNSHQGRNYIEDNKTIFKDEILQKQEQTNQLTEDRDYSEIEKEIISILNEYIRPAVEGDGGNIAFDSYNIDTKTVKVILQGACSGCPSSTVTLKNGIENMLKEMLAGKVECVEAING